LIELVRAIRNARSDARIEPGLWLRVDLAMGQALGDVFEALRPAIGRLARARPIERHVTAEALRSAMAADGGLTVIAGEIEAVVSIAADGDAPASGNADRARLEKELAEAEGFLAAARARLANEEFTAKAPAAVVDGARAREAELADQVERLRARLGDEPGPAAG
jgi:valyl-tRNA synthetase